MCWHRHRGCICGHDSVTKIEDGSGCKFDRYCSWLFWHYLLCCAHPFWCRPFCSSDPFRSNFPCIEWTILSGLERQVDNMGRRFPLVHGYIKTSEEIITVQMIMERMTMERMTVWYRWTMEWMTLRINILELMICSTGYFLGNADKK